MENSSYECVNSFMHGALPTQWFLPGFLEGQNVGREDYFVTENDFEHGGIGNFADAGVGDAGQQGLEGVGTLGLDFAEETGVRFAEQNRDEG